MCLEGNKNTSLRLLVVGLNATARRSSSSFGRSALDMVHA